ncbi:MAG: cyclic-phosphate processing receiver domain-containing protein [Pyrinomonadaceae bacterium]
MSQNQIGRILIVEDDPMRCVWFAKRFAESVCDVTCDVRQAIKWLREEEYDLILLDHDLIEEHYYSTDDDERTGYAVAAWLAAHPDSQRDAVIVVHSLNFYGAERMVEVLIEAGREAEHIPFHELESELRM